MRLVAEGLSALSHYFVGFALPSSEDQDASLGGSGTLVSIDDFRGILTADHVIDSIRNRQEVGLILPSQTPGAVHHVALDVMNCRYFALPNRGELSVGPDLGLLIPPPGVVGILQARKSFYNLSRRREMMLSAPPAIDRGIWALWGIPNDWTADGPATAGFAKIKVFRGGLSAGIVSEEYDSGEYDYLVFPALYNDRYEGPDSYEGVSGGGLWQILVSHDGAEWTVTDGLLSGVAFFQSLKQKRDQGMERDIICHGRKTIYGKFIDQIRRQVAA